MLPSTRMGRLLAVRRVGGDDCLRPLSISNSARFASSESAPPQLGRVVTVTSGKGGVGKTTTAASFAYGLAEAGKETCVIDFDIGLRNLDLHLGCERRVVFDFVNVIMGECNLNQALIKDKRNPKLHVLAASQTKDKDVLTEEGVRKVLDELKSRMDFVVLDSPAGIESGAKQAMFFADDAIICVNPEVSSCRDSDKMVGFISSKSERAILDQEPVQQHLLVTRWNAERAESGEMLSLADIKEILGLPLLGVIPESPAVLTASNMGQPVIMGEGDPAEAYRDLVARFLGEERELQFIKSKPKGLFNRFFGS